MMGMDRRTGRAIDGADHLAQSIEDILTTPRATRVGRRDYGSDVPELLDQPNNDLGRLLIFAAAALALLRQEGRARLSRVSLLPGATPSTAVLRVEGRRTDVVGSRDFAVSTPIRARSALAA